MVIKLKKIFNFFLLLLSFTLCFSNLRVYSVEEDSDIFEYSEIKDALQTSSTTTNYPDTNSTHIIAIDRDSKRILFEKDGFSRAPMASTTKILTAIIAIENCKLDEQIEISSNAAKIYGSTLGIIANSKNTMQELLYGLMLKSGNDCAIAIAEHIGNTVEGFSTIMNNKAKELGLTNTNFTSPHGLDNENHYTTAYDLALITDYALKNNTFKNIVSTKQATVRIRK